QLGDLVHLADGPNKLQNVTIQFDAWACQRGDRTTCDTDPGATFAHPITVTIYSADLSTKLAEVTEIVDVPFRPTRDATCPALSSEPAGSGWRADDGECYNGYGFRWTFDFPSGPVLPSDVVWTV
ncbi:MAG TPA: hypothetical protein PLV68_06315, partial [Ilumatobacteraceae bacterium]|nr:hypothetical protein [Ilumatobacteraceae bacterium]